MSDELGTILNEPQVVEAPAVVETPVEAEAPADTGEVAAPPAVQDDPIERHRKGLESAVLAERAKRQRLEAEIAQLRAPKAEVPAGAPDPAQYTDTGTYLRDVARFEAKQAFTEAREQAKAIEEHQRALAEQETFQRTANASVARGQAKYPDFDAAINSGLAPFLTPLMQQALVLADAGPDVAYYLAKNPSEAARVAGLSPLAMAVEIGRLESKVTVPPKPVIPPTLTQARDTRGQFTPNAYTGPTPLDEILQRR